MSKPTPIGGHCAHPEDKRFKTNMVSSRKPFGLETKFRGKVTKRVGDVLVYPKWEKVDCTHWKIHYLRR